MCTQARIFGIVLGVCAICAPSGAFAQSFDLSWNTIDGGGGALSTGGSFELAGTIGQPDASPAPAMTGGTFSLVGGFWAGAPGVLCPLSGDMNFDGRRDGVDVQTFVGCVLSGGVSNCTCADVDGNGAVNNADVAHFVQLLIN